MLRPLVSLLLVSAALAGLARAEDKVPLKLELPRPLFVGTPRPIKLANLEQPRSGRRPDFMVPAGTENLSKGKEVTSSDSFPVIGDLSYVTDGDKSGTEGSYVELGPGVQWVQIDLGASAKIAAIVAWHFHSQARAYHDVIVQISDDPDFKSGVTTVYNNDDNNSAGLGTGSDPAYIETYEGRIFDARNTKGRYVRLYSNGNTSDELNHYIEVEVYGQPAK
ncbi:MAG TPA: discoidin domain-containing protein [Opitutus sp.]|nr:discoidin domain-containing protein [Opitutus sp.]